MSPAVKHVIESALVPATTSVPGLMAAVDKVNLENAVSLLNGATPTGEIIQRIQYMTNPSGEPTTTGWAMNNSGGASTISSWNGAAPGAGSASYRATITTTPTGAGLGPKITNPAGTVPGLAGDKPSCGVWVHSSVACNMFVSLAVFNGATQGTGQNGPTVAVPANVWTQLKIENTFTAGANYDNVRIWPQVATADVSKFTPGATLSYDAAQFERTATLGPYYDGNTPAAGNVTYRWAGAPGASVSYQMVNDTLVRRSPTGTVQVGTPATGADAANRSWVTSRTGFFSVTDYGAVADAYDGVPGTDNTAAFQQAMNMAAGSFGQGGTMLIPQGAGDYRLAGWVELKSNVTIQGYSSSAVRKYSGADQTTYSSFVALSKGATGYGSSVRNVKFLGVKFRGKFGTGATGNAISLHHAQDVTVRDCEWEEANLGGHSLDLGGCDNILVDNCKFRGWSPSAGSEYVEAIQLDYSARVGLGIDTLDSSYDGLPCINITVQNSKFLSLTIGGTTYPAANPLGNHTRVEGMMHDNIVFEKNIVQGGRRTDDLTAGTAGYFKGWLHLFFVKNLRVSNNMFINTSGFGTTVLTVRVPSTGTAFADRAVASPASVSITPLPATNTVLEGNTFIGFNAANGEDMVYISGNTVTYKNSVVKILRNIVNQSSPVAVDTYAATGQAAFKVQFSKLVTVAQNTFDGVWVPIDLYTVDGATIIGNEITNCSNLGLKLTDVTRAKVGYNDIRNAAGNYFNGVLGLKMFENTFDSFNVAPGGAGTYAGSQVAITGSKDIKLSSNDFRNLDGNTAIQQAVNVYGNSARGTVENTTGIGSYPSGVVVISGTSTTVTASGTTTSATA